MLPPVTRALLRGTWTTVTFFCLATAGDRLQPRGFATDGVPTKDALQELNDASRSAYRDARERLLAHSGPIILVEGDALVLKYGHTRLTATVVPRLYHDLKSISHIPLTLYALLSYRAEAALDESVMFDLRQYRARIVAARDALATQRFNDSQCSRQERIIALSLEYLDTVIASRQADRSALSAFAHRVRPLLDENTNEGGRAQLDALHRQTGEWRKMLPPDAWRQLHVIVMGTQMPRKDNLAVQYFARLLGEPGEGGRIVYAEALFEEARALDLLGTRKVDTGIGEVFFDDPTRMHRDLLADVAKRHLEEMFAK